MWCFLDTSHTLYYLSIFVVGYSNNSHYFSKLSHCQCNTNLEICDWPWWESNLLYKTVALQAIGSGPGWPRMVGLLLTWKPFSYDLEYMWGFCRISFEMCKVALWTDRSHLMQSVFVVKG